MFDTTKYFPRSIESEHPSQLESDDSTFLDNPVTYDMVHDLQGNPLDLKDAEVASVSEANAQESETTETVESAEATLAPSPQLMIIFGEGDINSALHFLLESVHNPFAPNAVAMVLVEERVREEVVKKILPQLHPLAEFVAEHPNFQAAMEKLESSNLEVIKAETSEVAPPLASPIFVCECTHDELGRYPTGVVTFHTFRCNIEAIDICHRETLPFASVSIWNESLHGCYELAVALDSPHFFMNCTNIDLTPIAKDLEGENNTVVIEKGFHFETLRIYNKFKSIVFPLGN
ncbi:uncharacterized protein LOC108114786 [Drosophila eugracilis]|uniref:uncharacterized protein LOC108114786 n=1 Tax=Drosophila eugracilis TaxID=29029 RepID=UPI001BDA9B74|nr:uncharacterized protein LOC108114786 [Drosophila eugracilis]